MYSKQVLRLMLALGGQLVSRDDLRDFALSQGIQKTSNWIEYILRRKYVIRALGEMYYVKTQEEVLMGKASTAKIIKLAMNRLMENRVPPKWHTSMWYFGLYTALALNLWKNPSVEAQESPNRAHYVINERISYPKEVIINSEPVRFVRVSPKLFGRGLTTAYWDEIPVPSSNLEKTLLDFLYLSRYNVIDPHTAEEEVRFYLSKYQERIQEEWIIQYSTYYPKQIQKKIGGVNCERQVKNLHIGIPLDSTMFKYFFSYF